MHTNLKKQSGPCKFVQKQSGPCHITQPLAQVYPDLAMAPPLRPASRLPSTTGDHRSSTSAAPPPYLLLYARSSPVLDDAVEPWPPLRLARTSAPHGGWRALAAPWRPATPRWLPMAGGGAVTPRRLPMAGGGAVTRAKTLPRRPKRLPMARGGAATRAGSRRWRARRCGGDPCRGRGR